MQNYTESVLDIQESNTIVQCARAACLQILNKQYSIHCFVNGYKVDIIS